MELVSVLVLRHNELSDRSVRGWPSEPAVPSLATERAYKSSNMSGITAESSSRCTCRAGYHCSCSRVEVASRPQNSGRPRKIHLASDLMKSRTVKERVYDSVAHLFDERNKCCNNQCITRLVTVDGFSLTAVVDAIMAVRRGILCGDQVQKTERLRCLLNQSYDADKKQQHFFFNNVGILQAREGMEAAPEKFEVRSFLSLGLRSPPEIY